MRISAGVIGVQDVLKNIDGARRKIGTATSRGLRIAGLALQRESQLLVPVEFGVLKASAYTRHEGQSFKTVVNVGYTAAYALFVHERVLMSWKGLPREPSPPHRGNYWDPQGRATARFLAIPFAKFGPALNAVVANEIRKII